MTFFLEKFTVRVLYFWKARAYEWLHLHSPEYIWEVWQKGSLRETDELLFGELVIWFITHSLNSLLAS